MTAGCVGLMRLNQSRPLVNFASKASLRIKPGTRSVFEGVERIYSRRSSQNAGEQLRDAMPPVSAAVSYDPGCLATLIREEA